MVESRESCRELIMLDLDVIASVNWSPAYGERIREMRGKISMQKLADEVTEKFGYSVTKQYIQMMEKPFSPRASKTVPFLLLRHICTALGRDVQEIFDSPKIIQNNSQQ